MRHLRILLSVALWLVVLASLSTPLAAASPAAGEGERPNNGWPASMASTGDSITRAYNTGSIGFTDAPANSWSTGTNTSVNSHYVRILASNPTINGFNYNDAVTGAQMVDLAGQIGNVNSQHVDYVTVLMGANDACTSTEAQMTPVDTFRAQFQSALNALAAGSPDARVYILSVPNIYNLWSILHNNSSARTVWGLFSICQSMLANPSSIAQADVDRRNRVNQRVVDYNTQLAQVCATNIHCRFDNNTVYNTAFLPTDVSTRDYFHPSLSGQTKLAQASYDASFNFTDATAPVAWWMSPQRPPRLVTLLAMDDAGISGIEYRLDGGPLTRYTGGTITLAPGSTLTFRAVDINGNVGSWRSVTGAQSGGVQPPSTTKP